MNNAKKLFMETVSCFCDRTNEEMADKVFKGELNVVKSVPKSIFESQMFTEYLNDQQQQGFDVTIRESRESMGMYVIKISWDV